MITGVIWIEYQQAIDVVSWNNLPPLKMQSVDNQETSAGAVNHMVFGLSGNEQGHTRTRKCWPTFDCAFSGSRRNPWKRIRVRERTSCVLTFGCGSHQNRELETCITTPTYGTLTRVYIRPGNACMHA